MVCLSVRLLDKFVSRTKTAKPTEVLLMMGLPENYVNQALNGSLDPPGGRGSFMGTNFSIPGHTRSRHTEEGDAVA